MPRPGGGFGNPGTLNAMARERGESGGTKTFTPLVGVEDTSPPDTTPPEIRLAMIPAPPEKRSQGFYPPGRDWRACPQPDSAPPKLRLALAPPRPFAPLAPNPCLKFFERAVREAPAVGAPRHLTPRCRLRSLRSLRPTLRSVTAFA